MEILKFETFRLNETVMLSVLDIVIDDSGNVYNGNFNELIKGYDKSYYDEKIEPYLKDVENTGKDF